MTDDQPHPPANDEPQPPELAAHRPKRSGTAAASVVEMLGMPGLHVEFEPETFRLSLQTVNWD